MRQTFALSAPPSRLVRVGVGIAVLLLAVAGSGLDRPAQASAASVRTMRVLQYNTDHHIEAWNHIVAKVANADGPVFATIEEVCRVNMFDPVWHARNTQWTMSFRPRLGYGVNTGTDAALQSKCGASETRANGGGLGEVTIYNYAPTGYPGVTAEGYHIASDSAQTYGLSCVRTPWYELTVRVCATHLAVGNPGLRARQTADIQAITDGWINANETVVVGGDFNAGPNTAEMNSMYTSRYQGTGRFNEIHQMKCNCRTASNWPTMPDGRKLDYIFWSWHRVPWNQSPSWSFFGGTLTDGHKGIDASVQVTTP